VGTGIAGDHVYGAVWRPNANGSVFEYYNSGPRRGRPGPDLAVRGTAVGRLTFAQSANALFQVDDSVSRHSTHLPVIMTEIERQELERHRTQRGRGGGQRCGDERHLRQQRATGTGCAISWFRNRGHGSRTARPNNIVSISQTTIRARRPGHRGSTPVQSLAVRGQHAVSTAGMPAPSHGRSRCESCANPGQ